MNNTQQVPAIGASLHVSRIAPQRSTSDASSDVILSVAASSCEMLSKPGTTSTVSSAVDSQDDEKAVTNLHDCWNDDASSDVILNVAASSCEMLSKPGSTSTVSSEVDSQDDEKVIDCWNDDASSDVILSVATSSCETLSKPGTTSTVSSEVDSQDDEKVIDCWNDELTYGSIYFTASYSHSTKILLVHVKNAEGLPIKTEHSAYDVHLLIRILPRDAGDSRPMISHVCENSSDPVFDEHFYFYVKDISVKTIKISVFDHKYQLNVNTVGHTMVFLGDMPHENDNDYACKLYRQPKSDICHGHIHLTTQFNKENNRLEVYVDCAKGLQTLLTQRTPRTKDEKTPDILNFKSTYAIVELHRGEDVIQTHQSQDTLDVSNPEYNNRFTFNLEETNPSEDFIVVTVMKRRPMKESEVGHVVIGPFHYATRRGRQVLTPWGLTMRGEGEVSGWYRIYS